MSGFERFKKPKIFVSACVPRHDLFDGFCADWMTNASQSGKGITQRVINQRKLALVQIVSALYRAYCAGIDFVILQLGKMKFHSFGFGPDAANKALDILKNQGLIAVEKSSAGLYVSKATEVFITEKLAKIFKKIGVSLSNEPYDPTGEVVIVRDKDDFLNEKFTLPTPNLPEVERMRQEIHAINTRLGQSRLSIYLPNAPLRRLIAGADGYYCDFHSWQLRRIFARGSLKHCGRFYGAWWQGIPSSLRSRIRIDGESTVELDFGATVVTLLYAREGCELPADPYDLGINPEADPDVRELVKKYTAALLNAKGRYGLCREDLQKLGVSQRKLRELVEKKHHQVKHHFGTGIGLELMFMESEIALRIMLTLLQENIVVLPIHDGFVAQAQHESRLHEVMMNCFKHVSGVHPTIKKTVPRTKVRLGSHSLYHLIFTADRRSGLLITDHPRSSVISRGEKLTSTMNQDKNITSAKTDIFLNQNNALLKPSSSNELEHRTT